MARIVFETTNTSPQVKNIKHPTLAQYHDRVMRFLELHMPSHFGQITFHDRCTVLAFEDMLNDWVILVNRSYVGRQWYTPAMRYRGMIAFSETFTSPSDVKRRAFLLIRQPLFSDSNEFIQRGAALFQQTNDSSATPRREMTLSHFETLGDNSAAIASSFVTKLDRR